MIRRYMLSAASAMLAPAAAVAQAPQISDAQIAHIAYTAGEIDVAAARQALRKARSKEVREFARTMVRDHEAVNRQALALARKLGLTPAPNPTSAALSAAAADKLRQMARLQGAAYERSYVENEAAYHGAVNGALESTLIPNAKNAQLKSLLETGLSLFRAHQQHAEQLARKLR